MPTQNESLDDYVARLVSEAPEPTPEQIAQLRALFYPAFPQRDSA